MASAHFYTLAKRHNSTLQPTGTGTVIDVYLKGGSDILTPVFTINNSGIPSYNYLLFEGRFYFITGVKSVREDLWEISAAVDVLATYKGIIQATSAYVTYYAYNNIQIADRRLSVQATQTTSSNSGSFGFLGKSYCFALTVIGEDRTATYLLSEAQIEELYGTGNGSYMDRYEASLNDLMAQLKQDHLRLF